jgi:DNA-3-methyladenine glycosylase II
MSHVKHLSKDKTLSKALKQVGRIDLKKRKNVFASLCRSIMSQQLSTKVADVIHSRFINLFGGKEPTPEQLLNTEHDTLRSIGLSNAKALYIKNVAQFAIDKGLDVKTLHKMSNEELIEYLTEIKGVGKWTAEMILMFTLGREDVFAVDDLGIQSAMIGLYNLKVKDKKKFREKIISISIQWSPYRTYACMYLWRWRDAGKV